MRKQLNSLLAGILVLGGSSLGVKAAQDFIYSPVSSNTTLVPQEVTQYLVKAVSSATNMGTVSGAGSVSNDFFDAGQQTNLIATADTNNHFRFVNWTSNGAGLSSNSTYTLTVNQPYTNIVANFDFERFNVNIQNGATYGLNPTTFTNIPYGGSVTSTAAAVYSTPSNGVRTRITGLKSQ